MTRRYNYAGSVTYTFDPRGGRRSPAVEAPKPKPEPKPEPKSKMTIFQMEGHATGLIILPPGEYQSAACCDGRLVAFIVNREGTTRCVMCDAKEVERQAKALALQNEQQYGTVVCEEAHDLRGWRKPAELPFVPPDED